MVLSFIIESMMVICTCFHVFQEKTGRELRQAKYRVESYATLAPKVPHLVPFHEWSHSEKLRLLNALKKYGHYDLENLSKALPYKSKENIKLVIQMW